MNSIQKLTEIFSHFPGIGPRQAKRFVYYLLTRNNHTIEDLLESVASLKNDILVCADCRRFYQSQNPRPQTNLCSICADPKRDGSTLMIVPRDSDLESVEKNGGFEGIYFVLGGTVPILEKEPEKKVRVKELLEFVNKKTELKEIILGVNFNPEGENTAEYVKKLLEPFTTKNNVKISTLGKGFSMGTEMEYADGETMKNALRNRG